MSSPASKVRTVRIFELLQLSDPRSCRDFFGNGHQALYPVAQLPGLPVALSSEKLPYVLNTLLGSHGAFSTSFLLRLAALNQSTYLFKLLPINRRFTLSSEICQKKILIYAVSK
jgi:hypothetical protein